jgi:predicted nuclease of restriction endonuclease-like (RecB) superfamily
MCGSRSRFLGGDNMSGSGREILQRITGIRLPILDRLLRAEQARALLGISKSHFYLLVRRGEIPRGTKAFPEMKGFSRANLMYMRAFAAAWPDEQIVQQAVGQLPWGHNLVLLTQLKDPAQRLAYAESAIQHGWSRNVLNIHIETRLLERMGKAVTNFDLTLPKPQSDLARESLKDPYRLDFLGLSREAGERAIENALVKHVTEFLLELGAGFAFVGRQVLLDVGGDEFFIDLLFYHLKLRCYVVIELKGGKFKPEHLGQLSFYLTAVDEQVKHPQDNPTIGLLLCKSKNKVVAEYALRQNRQPLGVAEYKLVDSLPEELATDLPSIEQIEQELIGKDAGPANTDDES